VFMFLFTIHFMNKNQNAFSLIIGLIIIFVVGTIGAIGWNIYSSDVAQPEPNNTSSTTTHAYYAYGDTYSEETPPTKDNLTVEVNDKKEIYFTIKVKPGDKAYNLEPNVSFAYSEEKTNNVIAKTLSLNVRKIEDTAGLTKLLSLKVRVGPQTEGSLAPNIAPGHYLVKVTVETVDSLTKSIKETKVLKSSFDYK
jgi:hypothetical protein